MAKNEFATVNDWYVLNKGYTLSKSGNKRPRCFYLCKVADGIELARLKAAEISLKWKTLKEQGIELWPEETAPIPTQPDTPNSSTVAQPALPSPQRKDMTVKDAAALYLASIESKTDRGEGSYENLSGKTYRVNGVVQVLGADTLLGSIGAAELDRVVSHFANRPPQKLQKRNLKPDEKDDRKPKPCSIVTCKAYIEALKYWFNWLSNTPTVPGGNIPLWSKPIGYDSVFKKPIRRSQQEEKAFLQIMQGKRKEIEPFSIAELAQLYPLTTGYVRAILLLGLNAGFANSELNTLKTWEINDLDTDHPFIGRIRQKTRRAAGGQGVYARWNLWPETAKALKEIISQDRADELAITTFDGKPLIDQRKTGRARDEVRTLWGYLYNKVSPQGSIRYLSFKWLRKTATTLIRHMDIGGAEMATMFTSHSDKGGGDAMLANYASRDWDKLQKCIAQLRIDLQPMFDADLAKRAPKGIAA